MTPQEPQYETPTFHPRGAFARTQRGGEMARLGRLGRSTSPAPRYETPTFDPRGAFARTLRGGEMARRERRRQLCSSGPSDVLAYAA